MVIKSAADPVYRAALRAARDVDADSGPSRASAGVALAATLERHGIPVHAPEAKSAGRLPVGAIELDGHEGIMVSVAGDDRPDWAAVARQNRWQVVHLVHYAPRAVAIRSVAL